MASTEISAGDAVVQISNLSRRFGEKLALSGIELSISGGGVFGLIGANGAGKTTLLKHLLGAHYAQSGSVQVFGLDPVTHSVSVLSRIGYMSENRDIPNWMRVGDLISYTANFYKSWDHQYAEQLRAMFDLDPKARVRNLSRGQRARTCLLLSIAHRPDLLVLDEPSSGLDPVVRRDILGVIIRTIAEEGRTVLFSSHLLDEVERVADRIAILHAGRIQLIGELDSIKNRYRKLTIRFAEILQAAPDMPNSRALTGSGREWTYVCEGDVERIRQTVASLNSEVVEEAYLSLDEVFMNRIADAELNYPIKPALTAN